jgi:hypothetical protein
MTRGRSRKRHQTSKKSTDNDHSQTRQGEKIATPPAWQQVPEEGYQKSLQK